MPSTRPGFNSRNFASNSRANEIGRKGQFVLVSSGRIEDLRDEFAHRRAFCRQEVVDFREHQARQEDETGGRESGFVSGKLGLPFASRASARRRPPSIGDDRAHSIFKVPEQLGLVSQLGIGRFEEPGRQRHVKAVIAQNTEPIIKTTPRKAATQAVPNRLRGSRRGFVLPSVKILLISCLAWPVYAELSAADDSPGRQFGASAPHAVPVHNCK